MTVALDISSLKNALDVLTATYKQASTPAVQGDHAVFAVYRSATVKAFEYTYVLSIKYMERFIDVYGAERKTDADINFRDMLRISFEYGLITTINAWLDHRDCRNASSHGYQETIADRIFAAAPALIADATLLIASIEQRTGGGV